MPCDSCRIEVSNVAKSHCFRCRLADCEDCAYIQSSLLEVSISIEQF